MLLSKLLVLPCRSGCADLVESRATTSHFWSSGIRSYTPTPHLMISSSARPIWPTCTGIVAAQKTIAVDNTVQEWPCDDVVICEAYVAFLHR